MARTFRSVAQQSLHYLIRPHTAVPTQPIVGPAAWRGDELMQRGFVFNNPNQTSACGCGESVAITPASDRALDDLRP